MGGKPRRSGREKAAPRASSCPAKSCPIARGTWGGCGGIHLCGYDAPGAFFTVDGAGERHYLVRPHRSGRERTAESYRHLVHMSTTQDSTQQIRTGAGRARFAVPVRLRGAVPSGLGGERA